MDTQFNQFSTGEEVAKAYTSRCESKTFVITGTSEGGIGAATALALAYGNPKTLFLTGRTLSKTAPVIKAIRTINPNIKTIFVDVDLTDQDSIREAARSVLESGDAEKIHGLINNAGVMTVMPYTTTKQGIELQFGTNHIGHFLWTNLLLSRVLAAGPHARIVNVASTAYAMSDANLNNYNWDDGKTYHPWLAYAGSKTANILFSTYLSSYLQDRGVECIALQPGLPHTALYSYTDPKFQESVTGLHEARRIIQEKYGGRPSFAGDVAEDEKTLEQSASTLVSAALSPEWDGKIGLFLRNCRPFDVADFATNPDTAEKLWRLSEKLVGEHFFI
ncbi:short-chain dehydrogenase [Stipitochalara longipes BDJ]|nr:short-chain dehydrogenase [Stipitochalara longipes BDJ]